MQAQKVSDNAGWRLEILGGNITCASPTPVFFLTNLI